MSNGIVIRMTGTFLLLLLQFGEVFPQSAARQTVRIMFYNVENLFDIYDDSTTDDNEFLPGSLRRWNYRRYERKLWSLYKTIIAAGEWSPPEIIGFCEVENRKVLEDLIRITDLSKYDYGILHEDSPDPRGIDVCLIYRQSVVDVLSWTYFSPRLRYNDGTATRNVLYAEFLAAGDTVHIFVNHWPSRRGGVLAGESLRSSIAEMLRQKIDSLAGSGGNGLKIIITGDLNASPDDDKIRMLSELYRSGIRIVNLSENPGKSSGTYRYRGVWEMIDQVLVSEQLIDCTEGIFTKKEMFRVFSPDFLLREDPVYPGLSPFSTWNGYRYLGGFSDHLPVLLDLKIR